MYFYRFLFLFFIFYRSKAGNLTCAQSYTWKNSIMIDDSTCATADLCFFSAAYSTNLFQRRGCISGFKYFPRTPNCYFDAKSFAFTTQGKGEKWGYFCVCNQTNCNEGSPLINVSSNKKTVEISMGKKRFSTIVLEDLTCNSFWNSFIYNGDERSIQMLARVPDTSQDTTCGIDVNVQAGLNQTRFMNGTYYVGGGYANPTSSLFRIFIGSTVWPPFYFGLFTSFQFDTLNKYYNFVCNFDHCNDFNNLTGIAGTSNIWCYVGYKNISGSAPTCKGEFCFIAYLNFPAVLKQEYTRGCISQDYSRASGRIEVGEMNFTTTHYICAESYCNKDWQTAKNSIFSNIHQMDPFIPYQTLQNSTIENSTSSTIQTTTQLSTNPLSIQHLLFLHFFYLFPIL